MNCVIYVISIATCKPNLYVFIDSEVKFACSFYNYLQIFGWTKNVVYTLAAKSFNTLEIVLSRPQPASATVFLSVR
jgi:hypothetical protein